MKLGDRRVERLEDHPNLRGILGVLAQLVHISDVELEVLAGIWRNTPQIAGARDKALSPDSPLVIEVLATFDALSALYADDLTGSDEFPTVDPVIAATALKAVRDAIAAAYARPILSRLEYAALSRAWRSVFPRARASEPDLGPGATEVKRVLGAVPGLASRCHDLAGRRAYDALLVEALTMDEYAHQEAMDTAFRAAVLTGRRRVWTLVRRSAVEGFGRPCPTCRTTVVGGTLMADAYADERVLVLCADLACALLVGDALEPTTATSLTASLPALLPLQRHRDDDRAY